jgi:hypothetical protein
MRILVALKDAADRGEVSLDLVEKVADRLWVALWTEDKNTSEESVLAQLLDDIIPGGWEKWKHVYPFMDTDAEYFGSRCQETSYRVNKGSFGYGMFWDAMVDYYEFRGED